MVSRELPDSSLSLSLSVSVTISLSLFHFDFLYIVPRNYPTRNHFIVSLRNVKIGDFEETKTIRGTPIRPMTLFLDPRVPGYTLQATSFIHATGRRHLEPIKTASKRNAKNVTRCTYRIPLPVSLSVPPFALSIRHGLLLFRSSAKEIRRHNN